MGNIRHPRDPVNTFGLFSDGLLSKLVVLEPKKGWFLNPIIDDSMPWEW